MNLTNLGLRVITSVKSALLTLYMGTKIIILNLPNRSTIFSLHLKLTNLGNSTAYRPDKPAGQVQPHPEHPYSHFRNGILRTLQALVTHLSPYKQRKVTRCVCYDLLPLLATSQAISKLNRKGSATSSPLNSSSDDDMLSDYVRPLSIDLSSFQ